MLPTLPHDHPLRQSNWIWPEAYMYLGNHFAQFRWDFELDAVTAVVPFYITADKSYRLYVNGEHVCRGPARGYQAHWPYDEVDLAPFLRSGHNWISVEAYQPGCSTFQYLHQNYAGLLVATSDETLRPVMGKPAMRRSPGHSRDTARLSLQIDFQEHLDLRLDNRKWITEAEAPTGWSPYYFPPAGQQFTSLPFSRPPYLTVEPRGIPLLRETLHAPGPPTSQATGKSGEGYASAVNVSWHWVAEGRAITEWLGCFDLDAHIEGESLVFTIPATGLGGFRAIVIPSGEYSLGSVGVVVNGAVGGEILDFQHDQFFRDGNPHFVEPGEGSMVALANRLILAPGENEHEFYHPLGFGALTLIARDLTQPLEVRLHVRRVGYPFEMRGDFECSDKALNEIHAACRRTQQLCALDAYMDTPWREQAQWWGDARVQARNTFFLDGDARLLARGIRSLAGQSHYGLTPGHAPTSSYWCILPDFALTWILTLWDHYWQTGSLELFEEQLPRVREVLAYFDMPEAHHPSGLLRYDSRFWLFEDWADLPKGPVPTFLNLWYAIALQHLSDLASIAGVPDEGWGERAQQHAALTAAHLFDTTSQAFWPAMDEEAKPFGPPSVHDQTLAIMLGLEPEAHEGMLDNYLIPYLRGEAIEGAKPSAFWSTYVLEQAVARGYSTEAIDFIRRRWAPMMGTGTCWEDFAWHEESGGSACHAWSAHPSYHFVNALAGVVQNGPAWSSIRFAPAFIDGIDHAVATIPTPVGDIVATWKSEGGEITGTLIVPAGTEVDSDLPLIQEGRTYRFQVTA